MKRWRAGVQRGINCAVSVQPGHNPPLPDNLLLLLERLQLLADGHDLLHLSSFQHDWLVGVVEREDLDSPQDARGGAGSTSRGTHRYPFM
jgi:hypothetical protein